MSIFKLRASCGGKLATAPRSKNETLSETSKNYLKEWLIEQVYGYKNQISNKYVERGIAKEDEAISKAIEWLDLPFALKNEKFFEDEYFCGTPDLIIDDCVLDIKCSWSCFTFPIYESEIPTKDYLCQLQIYMHLTGLKKAKLVYILLDNEEIEHYYPSESVRHKVFEINYNAEVINMLTDRVKESREYIYKLL